jgi:hypothetical protein
MSDLTDLGFWAVRIIYYGLGLLAGWLTWGRREP